ncbi:MAG TPA: NAD(P)/FAD-dependent oxidoreductase [Gammaproteobacteria bacterium]|jgi:NADH dehydrogenase|nr:NAD(P)/FAD-dependent oxidoreductase [Gammaproteobacteria bacterium]
MKRVVIVGGGFAGLQAAKRLGSRPGIEVTLVDRHNHHVFQPLLYQVAMAQLSPADIAVPLRAVLSRHANVRVYQGEVTGVDIVARRVTTSFGELPYDYLLLASGASHAYFGHDEWEPLAPGLKTLEHAREIRRRVLNAYEAAECSTDPKLQKRLLSFVIVGGGPTGVELAGAIAEMGRFTLAKDFRNIHTELTRVVLVEAGPRLLSALPAKLSDYAARALTELGVEVLTGTAVTGIDAAGVELGGRRIEAGTVLWAAGVTASPLGKLLGVEMDRQGRVGVQPDLSVPGHPELFVAGDLAHLEEKPGVLYPGIAAVAYQQGLAVARTILADLRGRPRKPFRYIDKGQMATIGHNRAVAALHALKVRGYLAWLMWVFVHIYYLVDYRNRMVVMLQWAWTYFTNRRGARLIMDQG